MFQDSLFAEPAPVLKNQTLFFAILPDAEKAEEMRRFAQQLCDMHELTGDPILAKKLHVTVHAYKEFGRLVESLVQAAKMAGAHVARLTQPFEITFDRVKSFPTSGRKPCVLAEDGGNAALKELYRQLMIILGKVKNGAVPGYTPHVTLLYDEATVPEEQLSPVTWMAKELVLIHSANGVYDLRGRWPLQG